MELVAFEVENDSSTTRCASHSAAVTRSQTATFLVREGYAPGRRRRQRAIGVDGRSTSRRAAGSIAGRLSRPLAGRLPKARGAHQMSPFHRFVKSKLTQPAERAYYPRLARLASVSDAFRAIRANRSEWPIGPSDTAIV